jgi:hypothetical protein
VIIKNHWNWIYSERKKTASNEKTKFQITFYCHNNHTNNMDCNSRKKTSQARPLVTKPSYWPASWKHRQNPKIHTIFGNGINCKRQLQYMIEKNYLSTRDRNLRCAKVTTRNSSDKIKLELFIFKTLNSCIQLLLVYISRTLSWQITVHHAMKTIFSQLNSRSLQFTKCWMNWRYNPHQSSEALRRCCTVGNV